MSNFKDSSDQKVCLLEIISNQLERDYWEAQIRDFLTVGRSNDPRIQVQRELVSGLGTRIQAQRKELGIDVAGW